ncbi:MAG: FAD-binding oxidoreductase [Parachlamydiaceae bacterium]
MTPISCWNNYPYSQTFLKRPEKLKDIRPLTGYSTLARGLGRSYGDAALNSENTTILMERLNRFLSFDEKTGLLQAEAGVTLEEIIDTFLPRGWFPAVTPGTKYVTLGGCFAADVHGKNHHRDGSFSQHVTEIELLLADGSYCRCSPLQNPQLFWATAGGMGLTGVITEMTVQLIPVETSFISVTHHAASNIDQLLSYLEDPALDDKYSVAWIDCLSRGKDLGRGVLMTGHHAARDTHDLPVQAAPAKIRTIPCNLPGWVLKPWCVKTFNAIYYKTQSAKKHFLTPCDHFFYPLDAIGHWNRIYGKRGFLQYQFVIPREGARKVMPALLSTISDSRQASFLAVLKRFGKEGQGHLSFPMEGVTLALDIPLAHRGVFDLLDQLDKIVLEQGGRVYLAKDARLKPETFRKMYTRYPEWQHIKHSVDPLNDYCSDLARRLGL